MQTLVDHADYRITLHRSSDQVSPICVVTFGGQPSDLADKGFGTDFCLANGWDNIYVAQRYGTQYQGLPLEVFVDHVRPQIRGQDVVAYGPSLGAYCALYYGGSLDARIIASAPMFPAWRPLGNKAYLDLTITHAELSDVPRSSKPPVILFDPLRARDRFVIDNMVRPVYPDLRLVEYEMAGHAVLVTLQNTRQLKGFILPLISEDRITPIKPLEEGSPDYHRMMGRLLRQSDPDRAIQEFLRSLELEPSRNTLAILLTHLVKQGKIAEAQAQVDAAEASGDKRLTIIPSTRKTLREAGLRVIEPSVQR